VGKIACLWDFFQDKIVENVSRALLLGVMLFAFVEVVRRYFLGDTYIWYQDVAVYLTLTAVFIYFAITLKANAHIRLGLLVDYLERRGGVWKKAAATLEILAHSLSLVFCILFVWYGVEFVRVGVEFGRHAENADFLLLWPFYIILLVGFVFLIVEFARLLYAAVTKITVKGEA